MHLRGSGVTKYQKDLIFLNFGTMLVSKVCIFQIVQIGGKRRQACGTLGKENAGEVGMPWTGDNGSGPRPGMGMGKPRPAGEGGVAVAVSKQGGRQLIWKNPRC